MPATIDTRLNRLRERAERALASGRRGGDVMTVLETMTREAPDGSVHALFAHRHLAEMQLEGSPWCAALHLRRVIDAGAADDGAHALMGLCQALLGNYRAAVSAYRTAVQLSPRNPWYHHNLGHLLDVGLGNAKAALDHLRLAHRAQSEEDEITASLAHCLARLGQLDEARSMAERAVEHSPRNREHRVLLDWVNEGAPENKSAPRSAPRRQGLGGLAGAPVPPEQVLRLLEDRMPEAGFSPDHVESAQALWSDFCGGRSVRVSKPAVYAAAVEYAIGKLGEVATVTQAAVARRYGVAPRSISNRYDEIRSALALQPGDPRYVR
ncbi:MAG TPA: tetratricopeptide repeat protein [Polyangiales bacterium]